ncbi:uncharacterized protein LOC108671930 [Hyalella azteca]|uniref:Uncharacterized protein LOC108671930 n=1 Tax=Hyalella azteca TaxID=294128 RepID=A0A8B7NMV3_HYAAZ|nr:uncharacterized protein LOC108671930 [Hyalella azteca]
MLADGSLHRFPNLQLLFFRLVRDFFGPRLVHRPWGIANVSHVDDDGRTLVTYKDALAANGHVGAQVHYLKIDIEEQEYHVLPNIFDSGLLENVWQLHMEIHNFWKEWESCI